jgi:DNA-binding NarL/FixJ family response regulator
MPVPGPRSDGLLRVLVVDGDDRVRESLSGLLAIGDHVTVVGGAGLAAGAMDLAMGQRPDLVVVDPRLPDTDSGLAFIRELRAAMPDVVILAMSGSADLEHLVMDCGANGFVRKTYRPTELLAAIEATCGRVAAT